MTLKLPRLPDGIPFGQAVYETLKSAIVDGAIPAGERLREQELSERFKVSRTPVREALKKLEADALVTDMPGRGLIVSEPSSDEIMETYLLREVVEGLAARLAAQRASETDLARLDALLAHVDTALRDGDEERGVALNIKFDLDIFRIAGSPRLTSLIQELQISQRRFRVSGLRYPGRLQQSVREHRVLLSALRSRDPEAAEEAAREHMRSARDIRIRMAANEAVDLLAGAY